jgi:hypothetical protein
VAVSNIGGIFGGQDDSVGGKDGEGTAGVQMVAGFAGFRAQNRSRRTKSAHS